MFDNEETDICKTFIMGKGIVNDDISKQASSK